MSSDWVGRHPAKVARNCNRKSKLICLATLMSECAHYSLAYGVTMKEYSKQKYIYIYIYIYILGHESSLNFIMQSTAVMVTVHSLLGNGHLDYGKCNYLEGQAYILYYNTNFLPSLKYHGYTCTHIISIYIYIPLYIFLAYMLHRHILAPWNHSSAECRASTSPTRFEGRSMTENFGT